MCNIMQISQIQVFCQIPTNRIYMIYPVCAKEREQVYPSMSYMKLTLWQKGHIKDDPHPSPHLHTDPLFIWMS